MSFARILLSTRTSSLIPSWLKMPLILLLPPSDAGRACRQPLLAPPMCHWCQLARQWWGRYPPDRSHLSPCPSTGMNSPATGVVRRGKQTNSLAVRAAHWGECRRHRLRMPWWSRSQRRLLLSTPRLTHRCRAPHHCCFLMPEVEEVEQGAFSSGMIF